MRAKYPTCNDPSITPRTNMRLQNLMIAYAVTRPFNCLPLTAAGAKRKHEQLGEGEVTPSQHMHMVSTSLQRVDREAAMTQV